MATRFQDSYKSKIRPSLKQEFGYTSDMQVPRLEKIVVNMGVGDTVNDIKKMEAAVGDLTAITGQKPLVIKSKKAIANFKLRAGQVVGAHVTLRGTNMWEFLYRLLAVSIPTIRDFRGVSPKLDGQGNYNLGITDFTIFPEITVENVKKTMGLDITIVTTAKSDDEGRELLRLIGMPFRRSENQKSAA